MSDSRAPRMHGVPTLGAIHSGLLRYCVACVVALALLAHARPVLNAGQANYAAAKAGTVGMARALAKEWGPLNVQVNAVAYGWIDTRLTKEKEAGQTLDRDGQAGAIGIPAGLRNMMKMIIPMGRAGTPEEAAGPSLPRLPPVGLRFRPVH